MPEENRKLSPAEFLSELKAKGAPHHLLDLSPTNAPDELELDFSDLDAPAPSSAKEQTKPPAESDPPQRPAQNERNTTVSVPADSSAKHDAAEHNGGESNTDHTDHDESADGEDDVPDADPVDRADTADPAGEDSIDDLDEESDDGEDEDDGDADAEEDEDEEHAAETPDVVKSNAHLAELFNRVHSLLGGATSDSESAFTPKCPETLEEAGLTFEDVERLALKYLLAKGSATGRQVCAQIRLPFAIVDSVLKQLKQDQLLTFKGTATMGDYDFAITEAGRERARGYSVECSYYGPAPVCLRDYLEAMADQSIAKQYVTEEDLCEAFSDLVISHTLLERLGPAVNSGRGMFLYGAPGNGKTSIAERITRSFGSTIWIPRALNIDGDLIRVFDPGVHEEIKNAATSSSLFDFSGVDQRWVQIVRPTVIAGGELTMAELEVTQNPQTKICEAPLQLKSNCGTLVIDDFGRQRMPVEELLNRWIVPLEKRYDYLNMPSGKKIQVPFDQLIIFSTNLEPKDLVDGAFLRRIPYKIEAKDPTPEQFHELFQLVAPTMGFEYNKKAVDYLIETHYQSCNRPFRACQPRDLLQQVKNFCTYKRLPKKLTPEAFDFAVANYFSVM